MTTRFAYESGGATPGLDGRASRFAIQVQDPETDLEFTNEDCWELVVRETGTRQQLKALFFEDTRGIGRLAFQRFNRDGKPLRAERFTLEGDEVANLLGYLELIQSPILDLRDPEGFRLSSRGVDLLARERKQLSEMLEADPELLREVIASSVSAPDVVAVAARNRTLERFESFLHDQASFESYRSELREAGRKHGPENAWQSFLEENPWILGFGASVQLLERFSARKLEQRIRGGRPGTYGREVDGLVRTAGVVNALALVEIKHHGSRLTADNSVRAGAFAPHSDLVEAVAQCQNAVDVAISELGEVLELKDDEGRRIEVAQVCRPRSVLVIGSQREFNNGEFSQYRYQSFERFRRSLRDPEVLTFDELYERASFSVDRASEKQQHGEPTG